MAVLLGRAAIAIAAVRSRGRGVGGSWLGAMNADIRRRTDVMAITSLPARRSREGTCGHGDKLRSREGGRAGLSEPAVELSKVRMSLGDSYVVTRSRPYPLKVIAVGG